MYGLVSNEPRFHSAFLSATGLEEAMFTWSLSPGDGGTTGITVETPTLQQKKKPTDGGGKKGEQIIIETEVKQE